MPIADPNPATYQCRHIYTAGRRCRQVALRGENFCYHHQNARRRPRSAAPGEPPTPIEDHVSLLDALNNVIASLTQKTISAREAGVLLYAMQNVAAALPREETTLRRGAQPQPRPEPTVEDIEFDPALGAIAPITRVLSPEEIREAELASGRRKRTLLEELLSNPVPDGPSLCNPGPDLNPSNLPGIPNRHRPGCPTESSS